MWGLAMFWIFVWGIPMAVGDSIGKNKGYNNSTGFALGFLLGWLGVIIMLIMPYKQNVNYNAEQQRYEKKD